MSSSSPRSEEELKGARKLPKDWILALFLILGIYLWQRTVFPLWMIDLFHIQFAAYEFKHGEPQWIYTSYQDFDKFLAHREPIAQKLQAEGDPNAYFYPPFVAALLSPFSDVSAIVWRNCLFAINIGLLFVFAWQTLLLCQIQIKLRSLLWALCLVMFCYPMARATKLGQIVPLLAAMMWIGLLWLRSNHNLKAGIILGAVSAIKLFPLGGIAYPLLARKYKAVFVWLFAFIGIYLLSILFLGIELHQLWWRAVSEFGSVVYVFFGNQAPTGWYARVILGGNMLDTHFQSDQTAVIIRIAGDLIFGGITIGTLFKFRHKLNDEFAPSIGLLFSGILLALPVSWEHYWMFVLPVLGWSIHQLWINKDKKIWEFWLFAAVFFFLMKLTRFYTDDTVGRIISGSQTLGMLMLWIWFLRYFWNKQRKAQSE